MACAFTPDDPATAASVQADARCRSLGAVPHTQTYMDCRRDAFLARDWLYQERLDQERLAAEQAAVAAQAARADKSAAP